MDVYEEIEDLFIKRYKGWGGREQFVGTGERLRRMVDEMCWTPRRIREHLVDCFKASWNEEYNEMLVEGPISVWTFCPHHLLPCHFAIFIGYIPNGKVLGLSKFSRVSVILGRRPIMQEMYTRELANCIESNLKPQGVGVNVVGEHGCMRCRGVGQNAGVSTSILRGEFLAEGVVRKEFFDTIERLSGS